jgi:uncharacterized OB-fold protein
MSDSFPLPDTDLAITRPFWQAAQRNELVIPRCSSCGRYNWYPRAECHACGGSDMPWTAMSGRGSLFSWAVVERALAKPFADRVPYVSALVALEEAPDVRFVSYVVECDPAALHFDQALTAIYRPLEFPNVAGSVIAPFFTPALAPVSADTAAGPAGVAR